MTGLISPVNRSPSARNVAQILGVLLLVLGVAGFVPALSAPLRGLTALTLTGAAGLLFGLFPVNWLANLVHVALGIWGIWAAARFVTARSFRRAATVILMVLALCGLIPGAHLLFGLMPLNAHDCLAARAAGAGRRDLRLAFGVGYRRGGSYRRAGHRLGR